MLPKERRLVNEYDFRRVRLNGKRIIAHPFTLFYLKSSASATTRFGLVVSNKIDRRATARNRVKRLFREGLISLLPRVKSGFDIVLVVRRSALERDARALWLELEEILGKAGILDR